MLILAQQVCKTYAAQHYVAVEAAWRFRNNNATVIQRHWRGFLGRRLAEDLVEESCWPLKGFFEYKQTGPESVLVQVYTTFSEDVLGDAMHSLFVIVI